MGGLLPLCLTSSPHPVDTPTSLYISVERSLAVLSSLYVFLGDIFFLILCHWLYLCSISVCYYSLFYSLLLLFSTFCAVPPPGGRDVLCVHSVGGQPYWEHFMLACLDICSVARTLDYAAFAVERFKISVAERNDAIAYHLSILSFLARRHLASNILIRYLSY